MAIRESEILDKVGKYNLTTLDIISYQQQKDESAPKVIDIKGIADVINIHEDIFRHTIYGSVVVYDQQDIRSILPLTGLERLALKVNTPGLPGYDYTEDNGTPFHIYNEPSNYYCAKILGSINKYYVDNKTFYIRPENIKIVAKSMHRLTVESSHFKGKEYQIIAKYQDVSWILYSPLPYEPQDVIYIDFDGEKCIDLC